MGKHLDVFHWSISLSEGKKLIHSFHMYEKNSLKIFWSLNSMRWSTKLGLEVAYLSNV